MYCALSVQLKMGFGIRAIKSSCWSIKWSKSTIRYKYMQRF